MNNMQELRSKFGDKLKLGIPDPPGEFDPRDLAILKDDKYLIRVLDHCDGNTEAAVKMLWSTMIWRRNVNANGISDIVRMEYIEDGLFFPHGRDIDGCLIFIMKWKLYVKGQKDVEDLKKVVVYWLERMHREEEGRPVTLFFDMEGCGMNNVEIEIITYMISVLKSYYPKFVNYIIIYQMPWIMSAGFRIIKGILPAKAVDRLRAVNKDKLKDLVHPNQALKCWGGNDGYKFQFNPEKTNHIPKRVTFADAGNEKGNDSLQIIPSDFIIFNTDKDYVKSEFTVINAGNANLAFKIRTTGPEKFKVKPSSGILAPYSQQTVIVAVLQGFDPAVVINERFLILADKIPEEKLSQKRLEEILRNPDVNKQRLKCKLSIKDDALNKHSVTDSLYNLQTKYGDLRKSVYISELFELITLSFSIVLVVFGYLMYRRTRETYCEVI